MKNQSDRHTLSAELIAAYLDGNATAAECRQVLETLKHDEQLRELLQVSLHVDAEMGLLLQRTNHLPIAAMAANCEEGNVCCLECEKFILRQHGIDYDEQQLLDNAIRQGWLKENGTALHNVGRHLEQAGLIAVRQYESSIQDIISALQRGDNVIVAVDGGELLGDIQLERMEDVYMGTWPDHTVVVVDCNLETDTITIFDPNSPNPTDTYGLSQFANAWADSKNYLVTIKNYKDMTNYNPKPIDVSDVILEEDVTELREAIAENAHEIWAIERMQQGWTYGPERNDELKQNPCMVPYSKLPESEKEYDRQMAMQTIKLMKKLGYDLVKREDTALYDTLLRRLRYSTQTFLCPNCSKHGKNTPVYKHQAFCDVCGHDLSDVDWTIYDTF
jgi:hypothetical protein